MLTVLSIGMLTLGIALLVLMGSVSTAAVTGSARACPDMVSFNGGYGPNGMVDASDLSAFAAAKATQDMLGDFTGDGLVDDLDQSILAALLGVQNINCQNPALWWPVYPVPVCPIEVGPACPDMNSDQRVDASDVSAFAAALSQQTANGDFNGDGSVNALDQTILAGHLGETNFVCTTCPPESSTNSNMNGSTNGNVNLSGSVNGNENMSSNTNQSVITVPPRQNIVTAPLLTIDKVADRTAAAPGEELIYTVTFKNVGSATAEHLVLTDTLPAGLQFVDVTTATQTWNVADTLAIGASMAVTYKARVTGEATTGDYTNTASIRADVLDPVSDTAVVRVEAPVVLGATTESPTLTLTKRVDRSAANPGDRLVYTLTVMNVGDADATGVVLTDTLPAGLLFLDQAGGSRSWNLGTLRAGNTASRSYEALVNEAVQPGLLTNHASVRADGTDERTANATVTVRDVVVLGAETLAATGAGLRELLLAVIGGLLSALGLFGLVMSRRLAS